MNTQSTYWEQSVQSSFTALNSPAKAILHYLYRGSKALTALAAGFALLSALATAIAEPALSVYLPAITWAASFVFFAIAVDAHKPSTSLMALASGIIVMLTAVSSHRLGPEIIILAAVLTSAWLTTAIMRR